MTVKPKFLDQVRRAIGIRHLSYTTEQAYIEEKADISPPQDKLEEMEHSIWDSMTKKAGPD